MLADAPCRHFPWFIRAESLLAVLCGQGAGAFAVVGELRAGIRASCCKRDKDLSSIYSSGMAVVGEVLYLEMSVTQQSRFSMMLLFMEAKNFK